MNNFEDIFKNKFENFKPQIKTNIWSRINAKLNRLYAIKTISIISAFVVAIAVAIIFIPNKNIENTINLPNNTNSKILNTRQIIVETDSNSSIISPETADFSYNTHQQTYVISAISPAVYLKVNQEDTIIRVVKNNNKIYEGFELSANQGCSPLSIIVENQEPNFEDLTWTINNVEYNNTDKINVTIEESGIYEIILSRNDNGTTNTYKSIVTVLEQPIADFSTPDSLFEYKTVLFENLSQEATSFIWFVNNLKVSQENELSYRFNSVGKYKITLIATNELKCSDTITKYLLIEKPIENIIFPTALSPNKYGSNGGYYSTVSNRTDVFYPVVFKDVEEYQLTIFNKYGELIFESNDINRGWDGYYQDELVPVGVFIYKTDVIFTDGERFQQQGSVTVIYEK